MQAEADGACSFGGGEVEPGLRPPSRQQTLQPGGDRLFLHLRSMFASASESPSAYSAVSDNEELAAVAIVDGRLRVTSDPAGGTGVANIAVTATFADGGLATFSFVLTVSAARRSFLRGWRLAVLEGPGCIAMSGIAAACQRFGKHTAGFASSAIAILGRRAQFVVQVA